jgi:hypothetical protein
MFLHLQQNHGRIFIVFIHHCFGKQLYVSAFRGGQLKGAISRMQFA